MPPSVVLHNRPSLAGFIELALSLLIVTDAVFMICLHLGPANEQADLGSGALVLTCTRKLPHTLYFGMRLLAELAMSHVLLMESVVLGTERESAHRQLEAKEAAIRHYGHTMGHRVAPVWRYFLYEGSG